MCHKFGWAVLFKHKDGHYIQSLPMRYEDAVAVVGSHTGREVIRL